MVANVYTITNFYAHCKDWIIMINFMKTYTITFSGRLAGALGVTYRITAERLASNQEDAILALYDEYEHIRVISITAV